MPTYISLLNWTKEGIQKVKESPGRLDSAKKAFKAMGAEIKETYLVMGQYDLVVISEAPDDETISRIMLSIGAMGNVRTQTMRAFPETEYRKLINSMP